MTKEMPGILIQQKIQELQSALFFSESNSLIKLPAHVVTSAQTDKDGQVWFFISRPAQYIDQEDAKFPCRLDFFKKGMGFHLKVKGNATLVSQFSEISCPVKTPELKQRMENKQVVGVKVKIQQAECFETTAAKSNNRSQDNTKNFINRFFKQQYS